MRTLGWARVQDSPRVCCCPSLILDIWRRAQSSCGTYAPAYLEVLRSAIRAGRARLRDRSARVCCSVTYLPVAASPAISLFGFSLAGLVSGSLLVEVVCGWPGLGPLILDATLSRDFYLVIGGIMLSALFMVAGNLIADVMLLLLIRVSARGRSMRARTALLIAGR